MPFLRRKYNEMANVQTENGYTMIANELLEALIRYKFPPNSTLPFRICIFVIRKTYGYHKKMDVISLSQFQRATNEKNRTNLIYWIRYLVQAKILVRIKKSETQIEYGFNKDYEQWLTPVQARTLVQARSYGSASVDTKGSATAMTHKRKKENTKEKAETSSADIILLLDIFSSKNPAIKRMYGNVTQRQACRTLIDTYGLERLKKIVLETLPKTNGLQFFPTITTPLQLLDKFTTLESAIKKYQSENNKLKSSVAF